MTERYQLTPDGELHYRCPHCGVSLRSNLSDAGRRDPCPKCGGLCVVPGEAERLAEEENPPEAETAAPESGPEVTETESEVGASDPEAVGKDPPASTSENLGDGRQELPKTVAGHLQLLTPILAGTAVVLLALSVLLQIAIVRRIYTAGTLPVRIEAVNTPDELSVELSAVSPLVTNTLPVKIETVRGQLPVNIEAVTGELPVQIAGTSRRLPVTLDAINGVLPVSIVNVRGSLPVSIDQPKSTLGVKQGIPVSITSIDTTDNLRVDLHTHSIIVPIPVDAQ